MASTDSPHMAPRSTLYSRWQDATMIRMYGTGFSEGDQLLYYNATALQPLIYCNRET